MSRSWKNFIHLCARISSNVWKRKDGKTNMKPRMVDASMAKKLSLFVLLALTCASSGAEIKILPGNVVLSGPHSSQRLLVLAESTGKIEGDLTSKAKFTSSNPSVVSVDATGRVKAVADGEAIVTAVHGNEKATAKIKAIKTKEPFDWSFRNHVIPVLTKIGCNSGACHGALAGKGGFKLSLRGYAPETDHFVLTRQASGRRVDTLNPAHSLVLLKPTMAVQHGGGQKLEPEAADYRVLADWIAYGAPAPKDD